MAEGSLTHAEAEILREISRVGLMKMPIPERIREHLVDAGYIEQVPGGYVITEKGRRCVAQQQR